MDKIINHCKTRSDEWASSVRVRIEYFGGELHAADSLYHHCCDVNFRTGRDLPIQYRADPGGKRKKAGRPKHTDQERAFQKMCHYFEENDEDSQLPILLTKMEEYFEDSVPYGKQYLKSKLLEHYGDSLFLAESCGQQDIMTFREKTSLILRDYFNMPNKNDNEAHKRAIIEAAAKLIKSEIKTIIEPLKDVYPQTDELSLESSLWYIPPSLRCMLQQLFIGKDTRRKQESIGQAIVQAVRPRAVLAPLQLGLAVQMHHHFRSQFLIDNLAAMGYCSSYSDLRKIQYSQRALTC